MTSNAAKIRQEAEAEARREAYRAYEADCRWSIESSPYGTAPSLPNPYGPAHPDLPGHITRKQVADFADMAGVISELFDFQLNDGENDRFAQIADGLRSHIRWGGRYAMTADAIRDAFAAVRAEWGGDY